MIFSCKDIANMVLSEHMEKVSQGRVEGFAEVYRLMDTIIEMGTCESTTFELDPEAGSLMVSFTFGGFIAE